MSDFVDALKLLFAVMAVLLTMVIAVVIPLNVSDFISTRAEIEQLRSDVVQVNASQSEDVIGQVTQLNQKIARWRMWNSVPVVCVFVPNGWDTLAPIEIPTQ